MSNPSDCAPWRAAIPVRLMYSHHIARGRFLSPRLPLSALEEWVDGFEEGLALAVQDGIGSRE